MNSDIRRKATVLGAWTIEIPEEFEYTAESEELAKPAEYLLHICEKSQNDFSELFSTDFEFIVTGAFPKKLYAADLDDTVATAGLKNAMEDCWKKSGDFSGCLGEPEYVIDRSNIKVEMAAAEQTAEVSRFAVSVAVRGHNLVFCGVIAIGGRHDRNIRQEMARELLDTIKAVPLEIGSRIFPLSFDNAKAVTTAWGAEIPVPDGFDFAENISERKLLIVPDGYSVYENPMEAETALSVSAQLVSKEPYVKERAGQLPAFLQRNDNAFDGAPVFTIKRTEHCFLMFYISHSEDNDWLKANAFIWLESGCHAIHIIVNLDSNQTDQFKKDWRKAAVEFQMMVKDWLCRIKVSEETETGFESDLKEVEKERKALIEESKKAAEERQKRRAAKALRQLEREREEERRKKQAEKDKKKKKIRIGIIICLVIVMIIGLAVGVHQFNIRQEFSPMAGTYKCRGCSDDYWDEPYKSPKNCRIYDTGEIEYQTYSNGYHTEKGTLKKDEDDPVKYRIEPQGDVLMWYELGFEIYSHTSRRNSDGSVWYFDITYRYVK